MFEYLTVLATSHLHMSHDLSKCGFGTLCIHSNPHGDNLGSVAPPIYQTSTFRFDTCDQGANRFAGKEDGFIYSRIKNPTCNNLEGKIAALEGAEDCVVSASGMGAINASLITLLKSGDHVIADGCLYGCTVASFHFIQKFGIEVDLCDLSEPNAVKDRLKPNTRLVYFETPANPTMKIIDLKDVCAQAHAQENVLVIVDNTFSSPVITRPLSFGVDLVVHSMTKYLNGHTDVVAGCVCGKKELVTPIRKTGLKDFTGAILSPHDAWLVIRGLMTLELRVTRASENALEVAKFLETHAAVDKVYYPGLESHPQFELAKSQMNMPGSMITFELKGGIQAGKKLLDNLHIIVLAVSLGGCESLIQHPASMTHACVPEAERKQAGITDGLIRFSVGIENVKDIIDDLKQALDGLVE